MGSEGQTKLAEARIHKLPPHRSTVTSVEIPSLCLCHHLHPHSSHDRPVTTQYSMPWLYSDCSLIGVGGHTGRDHASPGSNLCVRHTAILLEPIVQSSCFLSHLTTPPFSTWIIGQVDILWRAQKQLLREEDHTFYSADVLLFVALYMPPQPHLLCSYFHSTEY